MKKGECKKCQKIVIDEISQAREEGIRIGLLENIKKAKKEAIQECIKDLKEMDLTKPSSSVVAILYRRFKAKLNETKN